MTRTKTTRKRRASNTKTATRQRARTATVEARSDAPFPPSGELASLLGQRVVDADSWGAPERIAAVDRLAVAVDELMAEAANDPERPGIVGALQVVTAVERLLRTDPAALDDAPLKWARPLLEKLRPEPSRPGHFRPFDSLNRVAVSSAVASPALRGRVLRELVAVADGTLERLRLPKRRDISREQARSLVDAIIGSLVLHRYGALVFGKCRDPEVEDVRRNGRRVGGDDGEDLRDDRIGPEPMPMPIDALVRASKRGRGGTRPFTGQTVVRTYLTAWCGGDEAATEEVERWFHDERRTRSRAT